MPKILTTTLMLSVLFLGCATGDRSQTTAGSKGTAETAIREANERFTTNLRAGNIDALLREYYTDDAFILAPNAETARGRDAIRNTWQGLLAAGEVTVKLEAVHVEESCDLAYEVGNYDLTILPKGGGEPIRDRGKYLVTWKRMSNGQWRASSDTFNTSMPAAAH